MSSGFVSGGTNEQPIERDEEWLRAQQELEASRRLKEEQSRQQDGKTLYEVLQANKASKQEAFEESIRLKNQFRTLDEDEIEFLDSVLESTRAKEEAVKKETTEQLDAFRRQQEEADKALLSGEAGADDEIGTAGSPVQEESQWTVNARKRKRAKEKEILKGVKLRKGSSSVVEKLGTAISKDSEQSATSATSLIEKSAEGERQEAITNVLLPKDATKAANDNDTKALATSSKASSPVASKAVAPLPPKSSPALGLALAGYSSDEDD